ncbi:MAG: radical SAM protein [Elusimicrobia bacterium]|nr:radical SAM protein [Elusimicrobiota bacterium]
MPRGKVFLIQMPLAACEPPLALAQLYAFLRREGLDSEVMDISVELYHRRHRPGHNLWSEETNTVWAGEELAAQILEQDRGFIEARFLERIVSSPAPVAGFSVTACSFAASLILARWIKARRPDALVVFGGQIFTTTPSTVETILGRKEVDAVVPGDGEHPLAALAAGCAPPGCPGLFIRDARGRPLSTGLRAPVDLDTLPFADFSPFDMSLYGTPQLGPHDLPLMSSRGCVRHCSYCGHWTAWKGFRQMSGERVHAEIMHQRKVMPSLGHPDSEIKFYDLLINGDMRKLARLAELLAAGPGPKLPWKECNALVRPEMTYELCVKLREAGCRLLILGLESGSQKVLDLMGKGQTVEQMKTVLKNIDRAGLKTRGNFMFGHPGETDEDFAATLDFLREMHPYIHQVFPSYTLAHLDGPLLRDPEKWGVAKGQDPLYWQSQDGRNTYPVRLERFRAFRELASSLGARMVDGLDMPLPAYLDFSMAGYHEARREPALALERYRSYLKEDPTNEFVLSRVKGLQG